MQSSPWAHSRRPCGRSRSQRHDWEAAPCDARLLTAAGDASSTWRSGDPCVACWRPPRHGSCDTFSCALTALFFSPEAMQRSCASACLCDTLSLSEVVCHGVARVGCEDGITQTMTIVELPLDSLTDCLTPGTSQLEPAWLAAGGTPSPSDLAVMRPEWSSG